MKHLLSIFATLLLINIANAQTVKNEIITIGGKKYLIYYIKAGETWASIAEKSGITERSLIDANKQANGRLKSVVSLKVPTEKSTKNILDEKTLNTKKVTQVRSEKAIINNSSKKNNKVIAPLFVADKVKNVIPIKDTITLNANKPINNKTILSLEKNKITKTNKNDSSKRYNWGDLLEVKSTVLEDNATKTTEDFTKEINSKEINSNLGETKVGFTHSVLAGETIEFIAKKYKITISDIANWNNLTKNKIRVGQELIVNFKRASKSYLSANSISPELKKQINNADKSGNIRFVEEKGLCFLSDEKFIGIAQRNAPVGTLLLLTSTENYKKIYFRVTSILVNSNVDVIIQVDKRTAKDMAFNSSLTNVLLSYSIIE